MRSLILLIASIAATAFCWGVYGPVLHHGQHDMASAEALAMTPPQLARFRPFVCVGLAYFLIGVIVPVALLRAKGEAGQFTLSGTLLSLFAGALGALGALGIILAFTFGGSPLYVMPLVFGGAPVVNSFLTIYLAGKLREIGPFFLAGLVMVVLGAVTVLWSAPQPPKVAPKSASSGHYSATLVAQADSTATETPAPVSTPVAEARAAEVPAATTPVSVVPKKQSNPVRFGLQLLSIAMVVVCWGAYGPTLHKGQTAMQNSRLRPLICVGMAYFAIAVIVPNLFILPFAAEASSYNFSGTLWSLAGGAVGALGALGIIMAFNFGGKPVFVMPLVFGFAPVINTLVTAWQRGLLGQLQGFFLAGLILVIAGAVMVLVFAPKGHPPAKPVVIIEPPAPAVPEETEGSGV
jgi:MFS family permease